MFPRDRIAAIHASPGTPSMSKLRSASQKLRVRYNGRNFRSALQKLKSWSRVEASNLSSVEIVFAFDQFHRDCYLLLIICHVVVHRRTKDAVAGLSRPWQLHPSQSFLSGFAGIETSDAQTSGLCRNFFIQLRTQLNRSNKVVWTRLASSEVLAECLGISCIQFTVDKADQVVTGAHGSSGSWWVGEHGVETSYSVSQKLGS